MKNQGRFSISTALLLFGLTSLGHAQTAFISYPPADDVLSSGATIYVSPDQATELRLTLGTSLGSSDLYDSGRTASAYEYTLDSVPDSGNPVYLRITEYSGTTSAFFDTRFQTVDNGVGDTGAPDTDAGGNTGSGGDDTAGGDGGGGTGGGTAGGGNTQGGPFTARTFENSYIGSFQLPRTGTYTDAYSGKALAISPDGQFLYTTRQRPVESYFSSSDNYSPGNANPTIVRLRIPGNIGPTANAVATVVDEVDLAAGILKTRNGGLLENSATAQGEYPEFSFDVGGLVEDLIVHDGKLIGTFGVAYDANGAASRSHFVIDRLDLASVTDSNATGLFNLSQSLFARDGLSNTDGTDAGYLAGYMAEIPAAQRSALSPYTHLTGEGGGSIISRTNAGPGAYLFNADDIGNDNPRVEAVVHTPLSNPLQWEDVFTPSRINQNINAYAVFNNTTTVQGAFFIPDTNLVAFMGSTAAVSKDVNGYELGSAVTHYGSNIAANDPYRQGQGTHSANGAYEFQMWVYDVDDYARVLNGISSPESTRPIDEFRFDFGLDSGLSGEGKVIGGVSLNQEERRLYVLEITASGSPHLVHVYDL